MALRFVVQTLRADQCEELADALASLGPDTGAGAEEPPAEPLRTLLLAAPPGSSCWGTHRAKLRGPELFVTVGPTELGSLVSALTQTTPSGVPLQYVRHLTLRNQRLGDAALVHHVVEGLLMSPHSAELETLDLTGCDLTERAIAELCGALVSGYGIGLRTLRLNWNPLAKRGGLAVSNLLQHNDTLERLELRNTDLDVEAVVHLFSVLRTQRSLLHLDVSKAINFSRQEDLTKHAAQMLHMNTALCSLDLGSLRIGDFGAELLSKSLVGNRSLRVLKLAANNIGVIGGEHLASLLVQGSALVELDLSANQICDDGATAFGLALASNTTLRVLDLTTCGLRQHGLYQIAEGMAQNSALTHLSLWGNHFEGDGAGTRAFDELLRGRFEALGVVTDFCVYEVDGVLHTARRN